MNVLFIIADDLRTELSLYGRSHVISPNIDRLGSRCVTFDRAYTQIPVCFPSRHSILTGLRPDTQEIHAWSDRQAPYADSMFSMLVRQNYHSAGIGKLFHHPRNGSAEFPDGRWDGGWYKYQNTEDKYMKWSVTPDYETSESLFRDSIIATEAIAKLKELHDKSKSSGNPFQLSVGFKLPHTQYHIPGRYFDMYSSNPYLDSIVDMHNLHQSHWQSGKHFSKGFGAEWYAINRNGSFPVGAPLMNYRCCAKELFKPIETNKLNLRLSKSDAILQRKQTPNAKQRLYGQMNVPPIVRYELLRGYLSGITFLDAQIGRLIDALDELGLADNTIIVFTADHGMHVGEKGMWEKYTLWEETTRVPLLICDPRQQQTHGYHFEEPVELIDILPTVLELVDVQSIPPKCPRSRLCVDLEGKSLRPILHAMPPTDTRSRLIPPSEAFTSSIRTTMADGSLVAISQMRRCLYSLGESRITTHKPYTITAYNTSTSTTTTKYSALLQLTPHTTASKPGQHPDDVWSAICNKNNRMQGSVMGYSARSRWWRYTMWMQWDDQHMKPGDNQVIIAEELYSHHDAGVGDIEVEYVNLLAPQAYIAKSGTSSTSLSSSTATIDTDSDLQKLLCKFSPAEIQKIAKLHQEYLFNFLAKEASFGFKEAGKKTKLHWEKKFVLDKSGHFISDKSN